MPDIPRKTKKLFKSPFPVDGILIDDGREEMSKQDTLKNAAHLVKTPPVDMFSHRFAPPPVPQSFAPAQEQTPIDNGQVQPMSTKNPPVWTAIGPDTAWQPESALYTPNQRWKRVTDRISRIEKDAQLSKLLLILLLLSLVLSSLPTIIEGISAYGMYSYAHDGMQHLNAVKDVFTGLKAHPTSIDAKQLQIAQQEIVAAHDDFQQLHDLLERDMVVDAAVNVLPQQVVSARALSKVGVDATEIGEQLMKTAITLAPGLQLSALTAETKTPLVTPMVMSQVHADIEYMTPRLADIEVQSHLVTLDALPLNVQQRDMLNQAFQVLPQAQSDLQQIYNLLGPLAWILGADHPHTLLVQTMDRAELRPTGGFTGQFGELHINAGRVSKFTLQNIGLLEENNPNFPSDGQLAPEKYRSWWPIPNWGLRDSNLSADFPTSAQLAINRYAFEFGHKVDGVVLFSPFLIARILQTTGPIVLPQYHETITALNFEARLHYYQLDNTGIRKEELIEHVTDTPDAAAKARKLFTARVSQALQDILRHAQPNELVGIAHEMLHALRTKDLQVYVSNPQIESLLIKYDAAAEMDRSTTHDGLYVVQANLSANKASQYVRTFIHDTVTLNAAGGATHVMQLRLAYNQVGSVYGLDTYRDYIRIYVPPSATFLWGDGFDTGTALCFNDCPRYNIYGNGALLCPAGLSIAGAATNMLNNPYNLRNHPLDTVGPPTNLTSDEPQRAMFGGWVVIPKNCTATVTLSWYVPPIGHNPYALLVQRQSSTFPEVDLTLLPTPSNCTTLKTAGRHFDLVMNGRDMLFPLQPLHAKVRAGTRCYTQPGV